MELKHNFSRYLFGGSTADSVGQVLSGILTDGWDMASSVKKHRILYRNETVYYENFSHSEYTEDEAMQRFSQGSNGKVVPLELPYTTVNGLVKNVDRVLASADPRSEFSVD